MIIGLSTSWTTFFTMGGDSGSRNTQLVLPDYVRDHRNRTNNILESFHAALCRQIQSEPLQLPGTLATRYDGIHAWHGSDDKRSQHQTAKEEDESNERDAQQSILFTVGLGILHKNAVSTRRESQRWRTHWCAAATPWRVHQRRRWHRQTAIGHGIICYSDWDDFHITSD